MDELFRTIAERHPWLSMVFIGRSASGPFERLPIAIALALSAIETTKQPLCFVLPRCGDFARHVAVCAALAHIRQKAAAEFDAGKFTPGERVRIHPAGRIFIYDGLREDDPERFWLRELNVWRRLDFPITALARLESTTRTHPMGRLEQAGELRQPPTASIDRILGLATQGNLGPFGTALLLLDSRSGFSECVDNIFFARDGDPKTATVASTLLPLGEARFDFETREPWLARWGEGSDAAPPLMAICPAAEQLAAFCRARPLGSELVLANGASLLRTPQHYHDICDSQRLVVFASHDETEALEWLAQTGCEFWQLGAAELREGVEGSVFQPIARAAANYDALTQIELTECSDDGLEQSASLLISAERAANPEEDTPSARVIGRGWQLLNEAASWIAPPPAPAAQFFLQRIDELRTSIRRDAAFIAAPVRQMLVDFAERVGASVSVSGSVGRGKGKALMACLDSELQAGKSIAIAARNEAAAITLETMVRSLPNAGGVSVFPIRALPDGKDFDILLVASWPGGEVLRRAASKLIAPRIRLVGYAFERSWAQHARKRLLPRPVLPEMTAEKKAVIAFGAQTRLRWPERETAPRLPEPRPEDFDVWRWETTLRRTRPAGATRVGEVIGETVPARYVRFVGDCFAFMMEAHSLPIVTSLLSGTMPKGGKLPEKCVGEWRAGELVVFPESGDRNLVREVADRLLGDRAGQLRNIAKIWRDALERCRLSPAEFYRRARKEGCQRNPATIRNWFSNPIQIGIDDENDLKRIAVVTGDEPLRLAHDRVVAAAKEIWSAHLSAGMRLRDELKKQLPEKLSELHETATRVDLEELGAAWIVMVEEIASEAEPRARNEANRLRWPEDDESQERL